MSILVANKVYRYFWSLVFWCKFKIRKCNMGPYCEHEVLRFLFNAVSTFTNVFKKNYCHILRFL